MRQTRPLIESLRVQRNVLRALFMREIMTRYGRHNIGFLWIFAEPMLFTLGVTALWTFVGFHKTSSLPIAAFALTGYSTVLLWRNMPNRCIGALQPNAGLMFHRNVKAIDIYLSRILLEFVGATMSIAFLSIALIALGVIAPPENILLVCGAWALTAWFGGAFALLLGAWSEQTELLDKIWHPAAYLLFPVAGAAYLVGSTPPEFQRIVLWLPMVHGVEMLRDGFFGSKFNAIYSAGYMATCNLVLTALGLALERKVSREFVPE